MSELPPTRKQRFLRLLFAVIRPLYSGAIIVGAVLLSIYLVGWAQRQGWIRTESTSGGGAAATTTVANTEYICPMMCTPPSSEPGRCPVCAMELVPATSGGGDAGEKSVNIAIADRRLVGIKTVEARRSPAERTVRGVGALQVDESRLARIPTDTGGRVEKLLVNFVGQQVQAGEAIATLYSPDLYAAQTELLTLKSTRKRTSGRRYTLADIREELITAARERLRELGMSREQIAAVERADAANTRVEIRSPQTGTVTKMMLREGQYIKPGDSVCEVADLSNVWLMTELFPEDASLVRYGQRVSAKISSLPGEIVEGRVSFIDPMVDNKKRAVKIRVDLTNPDAKLRPGDEATVEITVPMQPGMPLFDEALAGKWICPQHPGELQPTSGTCPQNGRPLVSTEKYGFASSIDSIEQPVVVPRQAILRAGDQSAAYVEIADGEFEMQVVTLGANVGEDVVVLSGLKPGDKIATDGNFLIDSQMQMSGKPSLIDPSKAKVKEEEVEWDLDLPPMGEMQSLDDMSEPTLEAADPMLELEDLPPIGAVEALDALDDVAPTEELPPMPNESAVGMPEAIPVDASDSTNETPTITIDGWELPAMAPPVRADSSANSEAEVSP